MELGNFFGNGMVFQILPKFKLRQLGESVQYNDQIYIENSKLKCKINSSNEIIEIDKNLESQSFKNPYKRVDLIKNDLSSPRCSAFLSNATSKLLYLFIFNLN